MFQSAPLLRGATRSPGSTNSLPDVSIRAPLARGDKGTPGGTTDQDGFNPRPSCEGRRRTPSSTASISKFQSAPLLRGATYSASMRSTRSSVSIRAPLARGDATNRRAIRVRHSFNPRPSCEGRQGAGFFEVLFLGFQSAPLLRGATQGVRTDLGINAVSIRAPLARGDFYQVYAVEDTRFQSAPLLRGATKLRDQALAKNDVSIRAPLARGDRPTQASSLLSASFNPRPSCEGRPFDVLTGGPDQAFQSAPLLRGATALGDPDPARVYVSIRAPLARGDQCHRRRRDRPGVSIRAPLARGDHIPHQPLTLSLVSIRAPLARGDRALRSPSRYRRCFNPRPSCEGRRGLRPSRLPSRGFNPRPSCEGRQPR